MMRSTLIRLKRGKEGLFCRVSQADESRGSAAPAGADSDGKKDLLDE